MNQKSWQFGFSDPVVGQKWPSKFGQSECAGPLLILIPAIPVIKRKTAAPHSDPRSA